MFELKRLSRDAVPAALEKAERYRLLNEPLEAESICRDILEVDPENQEALVILLLALTDQFDERLGDAVEPAREALSQLRDDYSRLYYSGILCERRAKAHLKRGGPRSVQSAYGWFREAMEHYEKAIELRPPHNDDALLRWNTCARVLMGNAKLAPEQEEVFQTWLE